MKLYLDGLERSGNVYLSYLLGFSLGLKIDSLRTHHLSTLIEYKGSEPFIVPVRDALPSLVSAKVYRDYVFNNKLYGDYTGSEAKIERILERYKEYTDYLLDNPQFFIAPFDAFTKDHEVFVDRVSRRKARGRGRRRREQMITRPLDLASRLRPEPRSFDWLFYVNGGVIVLGARGEFSGADDAGCARRCGAHDAPDQCGALGSGVRRRPRRDQPGRVARVAQGCGEESQATIAAGAGGRRRADDGVCRDRERRLRSRVRAGADGRAGADESGERRALK